MGKNVYSSDVKWAVVKAKIAGELTTQEIMEKYGIKNKSQISTWVRWYRQGELYRLDQPIGKQYTYGETVIIAPDRLKRNFQSAEPNQKWVTDITYIQYGRTVKYLSTIMDLYNNEIVAAKLYDHQQTPLVLDTLKEALKRRAYPEGVIIHSDQGSVYTSYAY